MNKNLIIKLAILLVVTILVYSIFWFFKIGQIEKKINNFISENSPNIMVGEVVVSGYPLSQKVVIKDIKFTIPSPFLSGRQVLVKEMEANAGIFSNDFVVTMAKDAVAVGGDNNDTVNVSFNKEPEITFSIGDDGFTKASYRDSGYRIIDNKQSLIYSAAASVAGFELVLDGDKSTHKINVDIREIEGFDIVSVYKNSLEKKINDGLKTGEITLGSASVSTAGAVDPATQGVLDNIAKQVMAAQEIANAAQAAVTQKSEAIKGAVASPAVENQVSAANTNPPVEGVDGGVAENGGQMPADSGSMVVADLPDVPLKSNFIMNLEYSLVPSSESGNSSMPLDPTQIQELPTQYSKVIKVNSLEFSNNLYKIMINGELNSLQDDNMPSGSISIKVEKIDSFINALGKGLGKIKQDKQLMSGDNQVAAPASLPTEQPDLSSASLMIAPEDPYKVFLTKVVANLDSVTKELAAKNAVSKEDIAVFDIRREKNMEFLVNETSIREILGKF